MYTLHLLPIRLPCCISDYAVCHWPVDDSDTMPSMKCSMVDVQARGVKCTPMVGGHISAFWLRWLIAVTYQTVKYIVTPESNLSCLSWHYRHDHFCDWCQRTNANAHAHIRDWCTLPPLMSECSFDIVVKITIVIINAINASSHMPWVIATAPVTFAPSPKWRSTLLI